MTKFDWTICSQCRSVTDTLHWDGREFNCTNCGERVESTETQREAQAGLAEALKKSIRKGAEDWVEFKRGLKRVEPDVTLAEQWVRSCTEARREAQKELVEYMSQDQELKADGGKIKPSLLFEGMPRALEAVMAVLAYGAQKYAAHSWKKVNMDRYEEAKYRHMLARAKGEDKDEESGLNHLAHEACNVLFLLEAQLSKLSEEDYKKVLSFNPPPQEHKK